MSRIIYEKCVAAGCNTSYKTHPHLKYFRFPKIKFTPENVIRMAKWLEVAGVDHNTVKSGSLCQRHFSEKQFYDGKYRTKMVRNTVPLYPTGPLNPITGDYAPLSSSESKTASIAESQKTPEKAVNCPSSDGAPSCIPSAQRNVNTKSTHITNTSDVKISRVTHSDDTPCNDPSERNLEFDGHYSINSPHPSDSIEDESYFQSSEVFCNERLSAVKSLQLLANCLVTSLDTFTTGLLDGNKILIAKRLAKAINEELDSFEKQFLH